MAEDTNGGVVSRTRFIISVIGSFFAAVAFMWAFGNGLFGNLTQIKSNHEADIQMQGQISSLADSVRSLVAVQDRMLTQVETHFSYGEIHQTAGEKYSDRENWWIAKERSILAQVDKSVQLHEAGGRPHALASESLASQHIEIRSLEVRVAALEVARAETKVMLNTLANSVSALAQRVEK